MQIVGPDNEPVAVGVARQNFGRGDCGVLDPACSRLQFTVEPAEDSSLIVTNRGNNPVLVERPAQQQGADPPWELVDLLDKGLSTTVGESYRFYIADRKSTTTFHVLASSRPSSQVSGGAGTHDQPLDLTEDEPPAAELAAAAPGSAAAGGAVSAAAGAAPAAASATAVAAVHLAEGDEMDLAGFCLLRVRGLVPANCGIFGARLAQFLGPNLQSALVSNYMIDLPWLLSAMPLLLRAMARGGLAIAHGEREPSVGVEMRRILTQLGQQHGAANFVVHKPPVPDSHGVHHSKAFLFEYPAGLRVVVHTANLIYCDCNSKSQGVWHQDFPPKTLHSPATSRFEDDLADYLAALRFPQATAARLEELVRAHDFSRARACLIVSRPGRHTGANLHRYGHMGVRRFLAAEEFEPKFRRTPIVVQFSSMGSLTPKWVDGELLESLSEGRLQGGNPGVFPPPKLGPPAKGANEEPGLQLVWPTEQEVRNSLEGWAAGGSIPGSYNNVSKGFLQKYYHRFGGEPAGRQRAMPHIKTYARYRGRELAWVILASHNLSKAAWGALEKTASQLHIRHFELGALLLPSLEAAYRASPQFGFCAEPHRPGAGPMPGAGPVTFHAATLADPPLQEGEAVQICRIPLPYVLPPRKYGPGDTPWCWDGDHVGVDATGRYYGEPVPLYGHLEPQEGDI